MPRTVFEGVTDFFDVLPAVGVDYGAGTGNARGNCGGRWLRIFFFYRKAREIVDAPTAAGDGSGSVNGSDNSEYVKNYASKVIMMQSLVVKSLYVVKKGLLHHGRGKKGSIRTRWLSDGWRYCDDEADAAPVSAAASPRHYYRATSSAGCR